MTPTPSSRVRDALACLRQGDTAGAIRWLEEYAETPPVELLGTKEAAEFLDVDRTTVSRWRSSGYLPAPYQVLATGPVWLRPALEEFREAHRASADRAGRRPVGTAART